LTREKENSHQAFHKYRLGSGLLVLGLEFGLVFGLRFGEGLEFGLGFGFELELEKENSQQAFDNTG
jgi:hypothetical protein